MKNADNSSSLNEFIAIKINDEDTKIEYNFDDGSGECFILLTDKKKI